MASKVEETRNWAEKWGACHSESLQGIGVALKNCGNNLPVLGAPVVATGTILSYVAGLGSKNVKEADELKKQFEEFGSYCNEINRSMQKMGDLSKDSKLVENLMACYVAINLWAQEIRDKKKPTDMLGSMTRKNQRLKQLVQLQTMEDAHKAAKTTGQILSIIADPDKEYQEGKAAYAKSDWMTAETHFKQFRKLVNEDKVESKIKARGDDHAIYYLWNSYENYSSKSQEVFITQVASKNPYQTEYDEFMAQLKKRQGKRKGKGQYY